LKLTAIILAVSARWVRIQAMASNSKGTGKSNFTAQFFDLAVVDAD